MVRGMRVCVHVNSRWIAGRATSSAHIAYSAGRGKMHGRRARYTCMQITCARSYLKRWSKVMAQIYSQSVQNSCRAFSTILNQHQVI
jgi:hypothetical protein